MRARKREAAAARQQRHGAKEEERAAGRNKQPKIIILIIINVYATHIHRNECVANGGFLEMPNDIGGFGLHFMRNGVNDGNDNENCHAI